MPNGAIESVSKFHGISIDNKGPGPQMMGNIGLTKSGVVLENHKHKENK
jgi:hypothetical protein